MDRAQEYKEQLDELGTMFEFEVAETCGAFASWPGLAVRAVLRFKDTELTMVYTTPDASKLGPWVLVEIFADSVKHALMNPKSKYHLPPAPLTYSFKEVSDEG